MDAFLTKNYTSNKSFTPHFLSWPLVFAWKDTHQLLPRLPLPIQFREYEEQDWRVGAVTSEWAAKPKPLEVHVLKNFGAERRADGWTSGELTNGRTNERIRIQTTHEQTNERTNERTMDDGRMWNA